VLQFSYTGVSSAAVQFLWCVEVGAERLVFARPGLRCDSAEYRRVLPLVVVAIVGFVVAFPVAVALGGWLRHRRLTSGRRSVVLAAESGALLTPLYGVFRPGAWFWSSLVLVRRSLFVVLDVVLAAAPRYRAFAFGLANQAAYFCSLYAAPFPDKILNRIESASQMALLLISALLTVELPPYSDAVNAALLAVLLATVAAIAVGACTQQRRKRRNGASALASDSFLQSAADNESPNENRQELELSPLHCHAPAAAVADLASPSSARLPPVRESAIDVEIAGDAGDGGANAASGDSSSSLPLGPVRSDDEVAL